MSSDRRDVRLLGSRARLAAAALLLLTMVGCAARTVPPPLPATMKFPEFVFPAVPPGLRLAPGADRIERGWRFLQNGDLRNADREFEAAIRRNAGLYPARTGEGYVALARQDHQAALAAFTAALGDASRYVPALVGRGLTLLELERDDEALAAFETAVTTDPSLTALRRRIDVLRFRNVQETIEKARSAAAAGRLEEAHLAYGRAIAASPESAFLHRELALVERDRGNTDAALSQFRRASALDSSDAASWTDIGRILEQRQEFDAALDAYRRAEAIEPTPELTARIAATTAKAREVRLPPEFHAIATSPAITRGELAALIGIRFEDLLRRAPAQEVILTDAGGHWAAAWIRPVARARVIEPFENHMFQPETRVRRGELATAVARLLMLMAADDPELREKIAGRPKIADMSQGHLNYPAAAAAVASGVMPLLDGDRFQVSRAVSGAEAIEAVDRLRTLE